MQGEWIYQTKQGKGWKSRSNLKFRRTRKTFEACFVGLSKVYTYHNVKNVKKNVLGQLNSSRNKQIQAQPNLEVRIYERRVDEDSY